MKQELRTMAEKQAQDPNELMENGLTRQQNEEQEKAGAGFSLIISIIVVALSIYSILMVFSI
jgi:CHASE3 domain sensor protein